MWGCGQSVNHPVNEFPLIFFTIRRIITLLFPVIKVRFNTLIFLKNHFGPLQLILMRIVYCCHVVM